jgi:hypothetical protein
MKTAIEYLREHEGCQHEAMAAASADGIYFHPNAMKDAKKDWSQEMIHKHPGKYAGMCYSCGRLINLNEYTYSINGHMRCEVCYEHAQSFYI